MSSLKTLLDAARFLELQELQEQEKQHRATVVEAALATMEPPSNSTNLIATERIVVSHDSLSVSSNRSQQAVVISSNNISSTFLQGPVTYSTVTSTTQNKGIDQDGHVTSTTANQQLPRHRILNNSFDIMNPLTVDETNGHEAKRKQPPLVFRAGTREVHNKLEKHRRAHLKECFDFLKKQLPSTQDEKKTSNLSILHCALRYIQTLKRKERELEHEMERLAREKISLQQRLAVLKKEISSHYDNIDFSKILPETLFSAHSSTNSADVTIDARNESIHLKHSNGNCSEKAIPILAKANIPRVTQASIKEVTQPVQTTALSVLPVTYPVNQSLVLQKVAIVPKGLDGLTPLVSTHFITAQQQINGKVVPITQYVVKPVVVVSTASPRPS